MTSSRRFFEKPKSWLRCGPNFIYKLTQQHYIDGKTNNNSTDWLLPSFQWRTKNICEGPSRKSNVAGEKPRCTGYSSRRVQQVHLILVSILWGQLFKPYRSGDNVWARVPKKPPLPPSLPPKKRLFGGVVSKV